jgi:UDP-N-acetylmuramate dehydrogenase
VTTTILPSVKTQISLAQFTSLKVGGNAQFLAQPRSICDLDQILAWAKTENLPITHMGAGSNLLISDRGVAGLVICTRYLRGLEFDTTQGTVTAMAGEPVVKLANQLADRGWSGLEWAIGIPGTIGGMVYMNAGAQGGCCADRLVKATVLTPQGQILELTPQDLAFSYRHSVLQTENYAHHLVVSAQLQLLPDQDPDLVRATTTANYQHRHRTQPYHLPNCGSVFRNPPETAAAQLIDRAGLKGFTIGQAQVSTLHANFIVNLGGAVATDIYRVLCHVQTVIADKYGIWLQPEVKMLGDWELPPKSP